ncbi:MAG: hypothetical protein ACOYB1_05750 [Limnohabitans sp.]
MTFSVSSAVPRLMLLLCFLWSAAWDASAAPVIRSAMIESSVDCARLTLVSNERLVYRLNQVKKGKVLSLTIAAMQLGPQLNDLNAQIFDANPALRKVRVSNASDDAVRLAFDLKTAILQPSVRAFSAQDGSGHQLVIDICTADAKVPNGTASVNAKERSTAKVSSSVNAPTSAASNPFVGVLRSTVLAANQGNLSGDYSQLYAQLSPSVQSKVRPDQLAQALKGFRDRSIDLSDVANLDPVLFRAPWEDAQGLTNLTGYFPTKPLAVRFVMALRQMAEGWRIEVLNLDTPSPEELAAALKNSQASASLSKPPRLNAKGASNNAFESPHLDWSTDPPTASKW